MGKMNEFETWEDTVIQVENGEPVDGGDEGPVVRMAKALGNRTLWLKKKLGEASQEISQLGQTVTDLDLAWNRITGKPALYPPENHYHEGLVPVGGVIGWKKSSPPSYGEWAICDGTNGTADMRDLFIVGAGKKYRVGDVGGSESVSLTSAQNGGHSHGNRIWSQNGNDAYTAVNTYPKGQTYANGAWRELRSWGYNHVNTIEIVASGEGQPHENRPPYYALYWIERIR